MSLKIRGILVLAIGTILGVSLSLGGAILSGQSETGSGDLTWDQARLMAEVMERVKKNYIDQISEAELLEQALRGMVDSLDSHSAYLDPSAYQDTRANSRGYYSGVGLEISKEEDSVLVISPIDDTPAQRAGVEAGDQIIEIDGESVFDPIATNPREKLRGPKGTTVTIRVRRDDYDDPLTFHLTRQKIHVKSVRHEVLDQSVGYLRLSQFNETTAEEAKKAIDQMRVKIQWTTGHKLTGLILDLRNNPGGILDSAVDISDLFLGHGVIVSAVGRTSEARFERMAESGDVLDGAPIVVLVNAGSASASEIVAGALQDHNRATILGTQTFGKGLVQTVLPLSRGRAIKLTTSHYFTPSGDSINETGITPDVSVKSMRSYHNRRENEEVDWNQDTQLIEALEILRKRPIMHSKAPD